MDGIIGWIQIGWTLELAWFASWPGWLQIGGVVVVVFAAISLLCWAASAAVNTVRWWMGRRGKRLTLAEKQAAEEWQPPEVVLSEGERELLASLWGHEDIAYALGQVSEKGVSE